MSVLTFDIEKFNIKTASVTPGVLKPDANGAYKIIVGGLNIYSGNGFYYKYTEKIEKILTSGSFKMKLDAGKILSEDDHPDFSVYPTQKLIMDRMVKIDKDNTLAAILDIEVVKSNKRDPMFGQPIYYIVATILPQGPHANKLIRMLQDPNVEVCFSVRSFSDKYTQNGIIIKEQKAFVTWDMVGNPGQHVAKKSYTNGNMLDVESVYEKTFTDIEIKEVRSDLLDELDNSMDLESNNEIKDMLNIFSICPEGSACIYNS